RPAGDLSPGGAHRPWLGRDNVDQRAKVADLQRQVAGAGDIQDRLRTLEDLLGLKRTLDPAGVPAVVIGNGVSNFEWMITISAGSDDGVAVGQPVVAGSATSPRLVGRVVSVTPVSSDVQLLIDQNFAVAGRLST